mmetsp:Transcript_780/g.1274  ORF Transcript_780/g.1274 Transcript_780/m.1274 type:complete len:243 (+) Transcript_780:419-1147(+)
MPTSGPPRPPTRRASTPPLGLPSPAVPSWDSSLSVLACLVSLSSTFSCPSEGIPPRPTPLALPSLPSRVLPALDSVLPPLPSSPVSLEESTPRLLMSVPISSVRLRPESLRMIHATLLSSPTTWAITSETLLAWALISSSLTLAPSSLPPPSPMVTPPRLRSPSGSPEEESLPLSLDTSSSPPRRMPPRRTSCSPSTREPSPLPSLPLASPSLRSLFSSRVTTSVRGSRSTAASSLASSVES